MRKNKAPAPNHVSAAQTGDVVGVAAIAKIDWERRWSYRPVDHFLYSK
jgi:hypothetical protein